MFTACEVFVAVATVIMLVVWYFVYKYQTYQCPSKALQQPALVPQSSHSSQGNLGEIHSNLGEIHSLEYPITVPLNGRLDNRDAIQFGIDSVQSWTDPVTGIAVAEQSSGTSDIQNMGFYMPDKNMKEDLATVLNTAGGVPDRRIRHMQPTVRGIYGGVPMNIYDRDAARLTPDLYTNSVLHVPMFQ